MAYDLRWNHYPINGAKSLCLVGTVEGIPLGMEHERHIVPHSQGIIPSAFSVSSEVGVEENCYGDQQNHGCQAQYQILYQQHNDAGGKENPHSAHFYTNNEGEESLGYPFFMNVGNL